jgi:hypothetical protein
MRIGTWRDVVAGRMPLYDVGVVAGAGMGLLGGHLLTREGLVDSSWQMAVGFVLIVLGGASAIVHKYRGLNKPISA